MSIRDEIDRHVAAGVLRLLPPLVPGAQRKRTLLVTQEVWDWLSGPWQGAPGEERRFQLRAFLDRFTEGALINVGDNGYMKPARKRHEEVWWIRSRRPRPSIRVLGRFALVDTYILTTWGFVSDLGGPKSREWRDTIVRCKTEWRKLFPAHDPISSEDIHDYISENVIDERDLK